MNTEMVLMTLEEAEKRRAELHNLVDASFDRIVQYIQAEGPFLWQSGVLPLSTDPRQFKGTKPAAVIFPDGRRVEVTKWRDAVTLILRECANTPPYGERLMSIRGRVMGRQRTFLADSPKGMDAPLEIRPELFMEGKFDTEALLFTLTKRVLDPVGYSYSGISVQLRQTGRR